MRGANLQHQISFTNDRDSNTIIYLSNILILCGVKALDTVELCAAGCVL